MPRRKHTFIQRSRAQTYHVVRQPTSDDPEHHVLVSDSAVFSNGDIIDGDLASTYEPRDFELGEFGFPEDGYNYSKHFRHIGGGGGVFMSAETGLPDPDAVRNPDRTRPTSKPTEAAAGVGDVVILKEDADEKMRKEEEKEEEDDTEIFIDPQASVLLQTAQYELERDRKWNPDLDQVLQELDANDATKEGEDENENENGGGEFLKDDGKLDIIPEEAALTKDNDDDDADTSAGEDLDGFFDVLLNEDEDIEYDETAAHDAGSTSTQNQSANGNRVPAEAIVEKYREPRLLDAQFENFMRGFDDDDDDSESEDEELEELRRRAETNTDDQEDIFAFLTESEKQQLGDVNANVKIEYGADDERTGGNNDSDAEKLLENLSQLQLLDDCTASNSASVLPPAQSNMQDGVAGDEDTARRREEFEGHLQAEFEQGMDSVMAAYERVPADEALAGPDGDGVPGALTALERQEKEEMERLKRLDELGIDVGESDDHDSELDTLFDEEFNNKKDEEWDCQTIISTYSNLENHPSVIDAPCRGRPPRSMHQSSAASIIQLDPRTQAPVHFLATAAASAAAGVSSPPQEQHVDFGSRRANETVMFDQGTRRKDESKSDKKARKAAVKEAARERRALKSEMKKAFGAEGVKQNRHSAALGNSKIAIRF